MPKTSLLFMYGVLVSFSSLQLWAGEITTDETIQQQSKSKTDQELPPQIPIQPNVQLVPELVSPNLDLSLFQVAPIMALQGGGSSYSLIFRYLPEYTFEKYSIGVNFAFSSFNNVGSPSFTLLELGVHGGYRIDSSWSVGLLLGGQSWTGTNGVAFFIGPEAEYHLQLKEMKWLDGIFVSYTPVFQASLAHLVSTGLTLKF